MPSIRLHEASALRSLSPKQQSLSPPLLQVTQPTITMPGNKRKRQHEGDMGGSPAITLNNAEKAARLAKDINSRDPRDRNRGPCVHCNATRGAAVQQPGLDLTHSCSNCVTCIVVPAAAVPLLVDPLMVQPGLTAACNWAAFMS